ncbi:exosortase-dependent surface protein XDP2 [Microcoleus sp. FACHB-672]|uniref:exosortase-dependent surface protein XDP2 n=1 Tax=Microcoleus sp. FACHB-672 TaxID=2692825 RepID=UPI00168A0EE1|nr:exosortase-dependent surface protein XDP2 [Microcoleus sp. FACHB-672]MBD2042046.1 PEP-CTERM sorting domain-containing protein [Microcoleus sp. FACHB-672]
MNFHSTLKGIYLAIGLVVAACTTAQAASFTTNFTAVDGAEGNIWLNSITQNQATIDRFLLVNNAKILLNTPITNKQSGDTSNPETAGTNNNTGGASTDKGDKASALMPTSGLNDPTGAEIAAYLGNLNLNNIIDTEEQGAISMNLFFNKTVRADKSGLDNLFFWERGRNSDLGVQAIDASGKLIGNFVKLNRADQTLADYSIDTLEINAAHIVGSWGLSLQQLGVTSLNGIRVTADSSYNGPDFKLVARQVPEPASMVGLGAVAGMMLISRRRQVSKHS